MNAPDIFALGGRQGDLMEAERELLAVHERRKACPDDVAGEALWEKLCGEEDRLENLICTTPPAMLADCAVKLRLLCHPEIGIEARDFFEIHAVALDQIRKLIEAMAESAP